ncbi:MAG: nucleotidyltransferase family protein [Rhodobacteraceae bacterium]|nr:nucleotidyltransferase family protein [Paracoccaceae bacterium]
MKPDCVMIFAAGRGTRMRHLTRELPKPLLPVAGKPLIDHALTLVDMAGVTRKVVNVNYFAEKLRTHLRNRQDVEISAETPDALETGGGLKRALPLLGDEPVFTLNPDAIWTGPNPLTQLAGNWHPGKMAALLLLVPLTKASGHAGQGDFSLAPDGRISRHIAEGQHPYVNTGAEIIDTGGIAAIAENCFSLNLVWDRMIAEGRLFGCVHQGGWADVGTPEGIITAEKMLAEIRDV